MRRGGYGVNELAKFVDGVQQKGDSALTYTPGSKLSFVQPFDDIRRPPIISQIPEESPPAEASNHVCG